MSQRLLVQVTAQVYSLSYFTDGTTYLGTYTVTTAQVTTQWHRLLISKRNSRLSLQSFNSSIYKHLHGIIKSG